MSRFDPYHITLTVFTQLRLQGFELGVDSLLTAYHAIDGGWGQQSILALKETLSLLWCHSLSKQSDFELIWSQLKIEEEETPPSLPAPQPPTENRAERREQKSRRPEPPQLPKPSPKRPLLSPTPIPDPEPQPQMATLGTLPVQAPFMPANVGDSTEDIGTYWPLSRREMV
ncbi:MAG: hypothetical protein KDE51_13665, partial [Anaerolineales bacterium]|nr:hypothetical protein [Anaerolineales bacterium]